MQPRGSGTFVGALSRSVCEKGGWLLDVCPVSLVPGVTAMFTFGCSVFVCFVFNWSPPVLFIYQTVSKSIIEGEVE